MSLINKGYVICDPHTDQILTVAKVAGEALYTAMQLEVEINAMPQIYSIQEYNKRLDDAKLSYFDAGNAAVRTGSA